MNNQDTPLEKLVPIFQLKRNQLLNTDALPVSRKWNLPGENKKRPLPPKNLQKRNNGDKGLFIKKLKVKEVG